MYDYIDFTVYWGYNDVFYIYINKLPLIPKKL